MVMDEIRDAAIQNTIVKPNGLNICPVIPCKNASGRNTTQVVAVPPSTDSHTRLVPSKASCIYSTNPPRRFAVIRKQLSRTTIELSTIIPTPSVSALMVMVFKVKPIKLIKISADKMEIGMEVPTIRDAFKSPKNSQIMIMEIMIARTSVWATSFKELIILSASSRTVMICKFSSAPSRFAIVFFTALETETAVSLCCFVMERDTVSFPL